MNKILIDTNILIDYVNGFGEKLEILLDNQEKNQIRLFINSIVIGELLNDKNLTNKKKIIQAEEFIDLFSNVNITKDTGREAGKLLREGKILYLADAFIAASCLQFNLLLYTNNINDFKKVKKLKLFTF